MHIIYHILYTYNIYIYIYYIIHYKTYNNAFITMSVIKVLLFYISQLRASHFGFFTCWYSSKIVIPWYTMVYHPSKGPGDATSHVVVVGPGMGILFQRAISAAHCQRPDVFHLRPLVVWSKINDAHRNRIEISAWTSPSIESEPTK